MMVVVLGAAMTSCSDSDSEKRIAELESRLADIEGTPATATPATNTPANTPATKPEGPLPSFEWEGIEHDFRYCTEVMLNSFPLKRW